MYLHKMRRELLIFGIIIVMIGSIVIISNGCVLFESSFFPTGADGLILLLIGVITIFVSFCIPIDEISRNKKTSEARESCYASEILSIRYAKGDLSKKQYEEMARTIDKDYIDLEVFKKTKYRNMIDFLLNMYRDHGFRYPEHQLQQKINDKRLLGKSRVEAIEELNAEELDKINLNAKRN